MNSISRRIERIAQQLQPSACPACGAGGPLNLLPIVLDSQPDEAKQCEVCGSEPIGLSPIVFDGDKRVLSNRGV